MVLENTLLLSRRWAPAPRAPTQRSCLHLIHIRERRCQQLQWNTGLGSGQEYFLQKMVKAQRPTIPPLMPLNPHIPKGKLESLRLGAFEGPKPQGVYSVVTSKMVTSTTWETKQNRTHACISFCCNFIKNFLNCARFGSKDGDPFLNNCVVFSHSYLPQSMKLREKDS